jgi:hypothetical protein
MKNHSQMVPTNFQKGTTHQTKVAAKNGAVQLFLASLDFLFDD